MSNSWWADKLGNGQAPAQRPAAPAQPIYTQQPVNPGYPAQTPQQPYVNPELAGRRLPPSASSGNCPNCGSGNYGGTAETKPRCYDCGYPIQQSGSGTPGVRIPNAGSGAVAAAKQLNTGNNYNPGQIIDRIG